MNESMVPHAYPISLACLEEGRMSVGQINRAHYSFRTGSQGFTLARPMRPGHITMIKRHILYEVVCPVSTLSIFNSYIISVKSHLHIDQTVMYLVLLESSLKV